MSKVSIVFREVPCDFNNFEKSAPFSNTSANFCVLQDACDDLSSDIRMYVNAVISKFVIRLMKYQEFHELSTYQEFAYQESAPFSYTCHNFHVAECVEFEESAPFSYRCHNYQIPECASNRF